MKKVALAEVEGNLPEYLRIAEEEEVLITKNGEPVGVLIGFRTEEDWLEYKMENDSRFLRRIEASRRSLAEGRGVRLEDIKD
ncbi:MAG TPA: type II toxin-antitoxin system prevent-host-death family antitoxin [Thermoanaerobaculia bacterium]